ncbi:unnamed protein product, partial [Prorocentrum cordatum]
MLAARSPPRALAPDVAVELGAEFTDRQMAQLRSVIDERFRAVVQAELGAVFGPCPSCPLGVSRAEPGACAAESSGGLARQCDFGRSLADGVQYSGSGSQATGEGKKRLTRVGLSQEDKATRRVVHELNGGTGSCSTSEPTRSLRLEGRARLRHMASKLVHENPWFDFVLGLLIISNSVLIGVETQLRLEDESGPPPYLFWIESFFLVCFVSELCVHWLADGTDNLSSGWFWFDSIVLVATGIVYTWIVDPILAATSQDLPLVSQILTLRVLRLLRLVRALRLMDHFKELWKLCSGLLRSSRTMLSVCALVIIALFVFGCLGVDLIATSPKLNQNEETRAIIEVHFSSLMVTLLTLMQFANADSIGSIYLPLCKVEPFLVVYFLVMWLVVTVALMNLVTA